METIARHDKDKLRVNAVGDKLLMGDGTVRYLLFFEADEKFTRNPVYVPYRTRVFPSRNGFHAVGGVLASSESKYAWYYAWKAVYPHTDYMLHNWNWLMPHTEEELDYILGVAAPVLPQVVRYYRDKAVWETYGQR